MLSTRRSSSELSFLLSSLVCSALLTRFSDFRYRRSLVINYLCIGGVGSPARQKAKRVLVDLSVPYIT
jgi:hypothetical protein